jgi:hypothetical protein
MEGELQAPLALIANTFISDIQVSVTARHRALSAENLDLAFPATKDHSQAKSVPLHPIPWNLRGEGHTTSPWRGRTAKPPPTAPSATVATGIARSLVITTPASPTPTVSQLPAALTLSASSGSTALSDDEWFSQSELVSVHADPVQRGNLRDSFSPSPSYVPPPGPPRTPSPQGHTLSPSPHSSVLYISKFDTSKLHATVVDSDSDEEYWHGPKCWVDTRTAHGADVVELGQSSQPVTSAEASVIQQTEGPSVIPYNVLSVRGMSDTTPRPPTTQTSELTHALNHVFDPIVPPGPRTEQWLDENQWHPRWANVFREVAEEYSMGKWVRILVSDYGISTDTAEAISACIVADFNLQRTSTSSSAV